MAFLDADQPKVGRKRKLFEESAFEEEEGEMDEETGSKPVSISHGFHVGQERKRSKCFFGKHPPQICTNTVIE